MMRILSKLSVVTQYMRFAVIMAMKIYMVVFWVMKLCNHISYYHCFVGTSSSLFRVESFLKNEATISSLCNFISFPVFCLSHLTDVEIMDQTPS
jgi:hypothetical protein